MRQSIETYERSRSIEVQKTMVDHVGILKPMSRTHVTSRLIPCDPARGSMSGLAVYVSSAFPTPHLVYIPAQTPVSTL